MYTSACFETILRDQNILRTIARELSIYSTLVHTLLDISLLFVISVHKIQASRLANATESIPGTLRVSV